MACLPLDGQVWDLTELDSYETPIKDGHLTDVVTGDLDGDGRKDLVFLETAGNYHDLVIFDANRKLVPANRWQVFEERTFRGRRGDFPEPREAVVADVTGDGKNDLIILVRDRILVYPQELDEAPVASGSRTICLEPPGGRVAQAAKPSRFGGAS